MVGPFSRFYELVELVFVLTMENIFSLRFHFKPTETGYVLLKKKYYGLSK